MEISMITLLYPDNKAAFSVMSDIQHEFFRRERAGEHRLGGADETVAWLPEGSSCGLDNSIPASIIFKWKRDSATEAMRFELSTSPSFGKEEYLCRPTVSSVLPLAGEDGVYFANVTNLLVGKTYYWRVVSGEVSTEVREFSTLPGEVRAVWAEGCSNIRDLGGIVTSDGRTVAQGKIYRGCGIHPDVNDDFCTTEEGVRVLRDDLGIKTEIELAEEAEDTETESYLGDGVSFHFIPIEPYGGTLNDKGRAQLKKIFDILSDEANYPVYFHCLAGADRTGTVAFLLEALLGLSEEDIIADYNLTSLSKFFKRCWDTNSDIVGFFEYLDEVHPGHTKVELMRLHLDSCGIGEEKLQKLRSNLLN